jgi:hypothetical protein
MSHRSFARSYLRESLSAILSRQFEDKPCDGKQKYERWIVVRHRVKQALLAGLEEAKSPSHWSICFCEVCAGSRPAR